jgi:hypothetical protein
MFPSHLPQQAAIASQLATELVEYQQGLGRLLAAAWDARLYGRLRERFDRITMYANALPLLAVSHAELVITRVELLRAVHDAAGVSPDAEVVARHAEHDLAIAQVLRKCMRYVTQPGAGAAS